MLNKGDIINVAPKVLVISNNALSMTNSNGRTLGLLLSGVDKENLMQFCIKDECITSQFVLNSYCVSDHMIIKSLFKRKIYSKKLTDNKSDVNASSKTTNIKKSAFSQLARDLVWHLKINNTDFFERAKAFVPDVILFQLGDSTFLTQLANNLAIHCNAKLVVFTTEDYYFKTWNYIQPGKKSIFFDVYKKSYVKAIDKLFKNTSICIANTPDLADRYANQFNVNTKVVMASASQNISSYFKKQENTIVYAGNLTLNRYKSIIEIADVVYEIDPNTIVEVYGHATGIIKESLEKQKNIILKGFVDYDSLLPCLANAKLLIHCESFDDFYKLDLQSAFSTKIADSLASGVPLLLYAPDEFSETKYLNYEQAAFVCTAHARLKDCVKRALTDNELRETVLKTAQRLVDTKHNLKQNQNEMLSIISSVCN